MTVPLALDQIPFPLTSYSPPVIVIGEGKSMPVTKILFEINKVFTVAFV
jgi:hypothetical protein